VFFAEIKLRCVSCLGSFFIDSGNFYRQSHSVKRSQ